MRKVWYHQIWIQNYFGFIVLILNYTYCSLRKDMNLKYFFLHYLQQTFTIAAPVTPDLTGAAASSLLTGGAIGQCAMDTFQVTGSGGSSPVICGSNDGQHCEFTESKLYYQVPSLSLSRWYGSISYLQAFFYFINGHGEFEPGKGQYSTPIFFWPVVSYKSVLKPKI